jgi:thioredoxin reductase (NADPH)
VSSYRGASIDDNGIKYWLVPEFKSLIARGRIEAHFDTVVRCITPTHVTLAERAGGSHDVPVDFVLAQIGYVQDTTLFRKAGLRTAGARGTRRSFDEATMESSVPGIYVAGTAVGGTQEKYSVFIENCHVHVERIMRALFGVEVGAARVQVDLPES